MPRSNGVYNLPPGYLGVTGETILTSQHNGPLEDIAAALTASLPRDGSAPMLGNLPMGGFRLTGLATGTASTDAVTLAQMLSQILKAAPVGRVADYAGSTAPSGWLFCYGQAVLRSTYSALDTAIYCGDSLNATAAFGYRTTSATDPSANRSTSGNYIVLPDCRGRVAAGKDDMGGVAAERLTGQPGGVDGSKLGASGGAEEVALTEDQNGPHNHELTDPGHTHPYLVKFSARGADSAVGTGYVDFQTNNTRTTASQTTGITLADSGEGEPHLNVQPTIIFNKIIYTGV